MPFTNKTKKGTDNGSQQQQYEQPIIRPLRSIPSYTSIRRNKSSVYLERDILNIMCYTIIQKLEIKDRKYRLRKYKQCFIASEVIDLMLELHIVDTRKDGIELGRLLQTEMKLWVHVTNPKKQFNDKYLFFRLIQKQEIQNNCYYPSVEYTPDTSTVEEEEGENESSMNLSAPHSKRFSDIDFTDTWRSDINDSNAEIFIGNLSIESDGDDDDDDSEDDYYEEDE